MANTLKHAASIDDLRLLARRRMPGFAFDFIDGGAEDEQNLRKNRTAFEAIELWPRYLIDVSERSTSVELFGRQYATPFGIAPVGFLNMAWPGADLMAARLAAQRQIPHIVSTASSTALEILAETAAGYSWFQLYVSGNEKIHRGILERIKSAAYDVLVVTIDIPTSGKRDRDIRSGLQVPFKLTPKLLLDLALHPRWALATLRAGSPELANIMPYADAGAQTLAAMQAELISGSFDWDGLKRLRDDWSGKLLLKGILHPQDAKLALEAGCDGIIVSNHGGRQLSYGPAAVSALPGIVKAVNGRVPVLLDGGIRRGADIIRAKALGAAFVFCGRPFAYGAGAGGEAGMQRAFDLLFMELDYALGQLGFSEIANVDSSILQVDD